MPDITVSMGPSGVEQVIGALKKVEAEAKRAGASTSAAAAGVERMSTALSGLKGMVGALGIGYLVREFAGLVSKSVDAVDALGDLSEASGISIESLSAVAMAARECGTKFEVIEKGVIAFSQAIDGAVSGNQKAAEAFTRIGLSVKDLSKMTPDEAFAKTVQSMAGMEAGFAKIAIAKSIFGRNGAEIIDVCNRMGKEGFDELKKRAESSGQTITEKMKETAGNMKRDLGTMEAQLMILSMDFVTEFQPKMKQGFDALYATVGGGKSVMQSLGDATGKVFRAMIAGVIVVTKAFQGMWAMIKSAPEVAQSVGNRVAGWVRTAHSGVSRAFSWVTPESWGLGDAADAQAAQAEEDFRNASAQWRGTTSRLAQELGGLQDELKKAFEVLLKPAEILKEAPEKDTRKAGSGSTKSGSESALIAAKREYLKAAMDVENAIIEAALAVRNDQEKAAYEHGLAATENNYSERLAVIRDYYTGQRALATQRAQEEIAQMRATVAEMEKAQPKNEADATKQKTDLLKLNGEIRLREIELQKTMNTLTEQELVALRQANEVKTQNETAAAQTLDDLREKNMRSMGLDSEADLAALERELAGYREKLSLTTANKEELEAEIALRRQLGTAAIAYNQQQTMVQAAFSQFEQDRANIQKQVDSHFLSQYQGEEALRNLEKARLPILQQLVEALRAAAAATGNQTYLDEANAWDSRIASIQANVANATVTFTQFKNQALDAAAQSLTNFFASGINNAKSFGDAMRGMALGVVQAIQQIIAQMLVMMIMQRLMGFLGGGVGGSMFNIGKTVRPGGAATGGYISGPGTGTSDSIPAWLSNGEFVVRAAVVRQPGVLDMLRGLNSGLTIAQPSYRTRFAAGGLVESGSGSNGDNDGVLTIGLQDGLFANWVKSPSGKRVLVQAIGDQRRAVRRVLGG